MDEDGGVDEREGACVVLVVAVLGAAWLGVLTVVVVLLVRQLGLVTARLSYGPAATHADSLELGAAVPAVARFALPPGTIDLGYVVFLSGDCEPCHGFAETLDESLPEQTVFVMTGDTRAASDLVDHIPGEPAIVRDPLAREITEAFRVSATPLALKLREGVVSGRARLRNAQDLIALATPPALIIDGSSRG
jgi:hypothetical protein